MKKIVPLLIRIGATLLIGAFLSFIFLAKTDSLADAILIGFFYSICVVLVFSVLQKFVSTKLSVFSSGQQWVLQTIIYTIGLSFSYLVGFIFQNAILLPVDTLKEIISTKLWQGFVGLVSASSENQITETLIPAEISGMIITFFAIVFLIGMVSLLGSYIEMRWQDNKKREAVEKAELASLQAKAAQAQTRAIKAENDRKTIELEEARQLQLSMLPKAVPITENFDIAAYMKTATEVGGDYYDFCIKNDGALYIAIGDATGHGLKAGTMVSVIKGLFYAIALELSFKNFFNKCTDTLKKMRFGNIYMALSLIKIKNNKLIYSAAGMPPLYIFRSKSNAVDEIVHKTMPLGAFANYNYTESSTTVEAGDTILLLTDGLHESFNRKKELFDLSRVKEKFENIAGHNSETIIHSLVEAGDNWRKSVPQKDDITFVVIKILQNSV